MLPLQGFTFNGVLLSPRLAPWAINISPLRGYGST